MRLKCLAGAYAGQIRDYSMPVGLAALKAGTAERIDHPALVAGITLAAASDASARVAVKQPSGKKARRSETTAA